MDFNKVSKLALVYFSELSEKYKVIINLKYYMFGIKKQFKNPNLIKKYEKELDLYLKNIKCDMNILKYLLKNNKSIYEKNFFVTLLTLLEAQELRYKFLDELILNIQNALDMNLEGKLYVPRKRYLESEYDYFINYADGIALESVKDFISDEEILSDEEINMFTDALRIRTSSIELSLFCEKQTSTNVMISIQNYVTLATYLINNKNNRIIIPDENSDELANFYKLLYRAMHPKIADILLVSSPTISLFETYNGEPFKEQIIKLEKIKKENKN